MLRTLGQCLVVDSVSPAREAANAKPVSEQRYLGKMHKLTKFYNVHM